MPKLINISYIENYIPKIPHLNMKWKTNKLNVLNNKRELISLLFNTFGFGAVLYTCLYLPFCHAYVPKIKTNNTIVFCRLRKPYKIMCIRTSTSTRKVKIIIWYILNWLKLYDFEFRCLDQAPFIFYPKKIEILCKCLVNTYQFYVGRMIAQGQFWNSYGHSDLFLSYSYNTFFLKTEKLF